MRTTAIAHRYSWYLISAAAIVIAVIFGFLLAVRSPFSAEKEVVLPSPVTADDHILGNPDAKVRVVMYSNTACSFCKDFFDNDFEMLLEEYGDKMLFVYRHYPVQRLTSSYLEAHASECVYASKGHVTFWEYVHKLYEAPREKDAANALPLSTILALASETGASKDDVGTCLQKGELRPRLEAHLKDAFRMEVPFAPSFSIDNGTSQILVRGHSYAQIAAAIDVLSK